VPTGTPRINSTQFIYSVVNTSSVDLPGYDALSRVETSMGFNVSAYYHPVPCLNVTYLIVSNFTVINGTVWNITTVYNMGNDSHPVNVTVTQTLYADGLQEVNTTAWELHCPNNPTPTPNAGGGQGWYYELDEALVALLDWSNVSVSTVAAMTPLERLRNIDSTWDIEQAALRLVDLFGGQDDEHGELMPAHVPRWTRSVASQANDLPIDVRPAHSGGTHYCQREF
jgi:hypothetical protein